MMGKGFRSRIFKHWNRLAREVVEKQPKLVLQMTSRGPF